MTFTVGPNVNVSNIPTRDQSEVAIAVNTANPQNLIASSNDIGGANDLIWFSQNGGSNWTQVTIPNPANESAGGDPTVAFNRTGTIACYAHLTFSGGNTHVSAAQSVNGGVSWTASAATTGNTNYDKEFLGVGPDVNYLAQDQFYIGFQDRGIQRIIS